MRSPPLAQQIVLFQTEAISRRFTMTSLTIKDLAHSEELSVTALSAVRGGSNYNIGNLNAAYGGGFASPGVVVAPVTQTDTNTKVVIPTIQNFGGVQLASL
jgi:hypothetical protein